MEVTKYNFVDQLEAISKNLKRSCFISFDAEFTAILAKECFQHRLFDSCEERYNKMVNDVSKMIITQVGLTTFCYDRDNDSYIATGYTFHLCPQVLGSIDQSFIFQASTLEFLCRNNFDFNKFIYEGIPYLSKAEELSVKQQLRDNVLLGNLLRSMTMEDEKLLQACCSDVSKWLSNSEDGTLYLNAVNPVLRYIIHSELRLRFPEVLTTDSLGNSNKILIYRNKHVEGANSMPVEQLEEKLINHLLGFSQIINLLAIYKKPIVGHNSFLDLILLHNQFIGPLPNKYSKFKKNINAIFPNIYDTKYISFQMSRKLTLDEVWSSNALKDLYEFFSERKCKKLEEGLNFIRLETPFNVKQSYHEAGWDSYCSGFCFIRFGHWMAYINSGKYKPVSPAEIFAALSPFANKVNVIRGAVPYMYLVGEDPPRHRPELLHIKSLKEKTINIGKVLSILTNIGSFDVKAYGTRSALIAASSQFAVDKLFKQFRFSRDYRISKFNVYRHTAVARFALWGGALLSGSLMLYLIAMKSNKLIK